MSYMMKEDSQFEFARRRATLYLCVDLTCVRTILDIASNEELYLPVLCSIYILIGRDYPDQTGITILRYGSIEAPFFSC